MTMTDFNTEDKFAGFLAPDAILPMQFFQSLRSKGQFDGERRLMIAILEDAVNCFMKQLHAVDPKARQLYLDAEEWIMAEDPSWFFSFENVCNTLDLNPEYLREGLRKWRDAERRRVAEAHATTAKPEQRDDAEATARDHGELRLVQRG
jgi:hypothetical protein